MSFVVLLREAKSIHQSLKELLKSKEPFDKEVDFQRKNLRRRYLNLLLVHPTARESKDVENHLWMQTSYAFISSYKQRIAALDRAIQNNQRQQQQPPQPKNNHGSVEYRKLTQRFRQFLAEEDKFWTQLVLRLYRLFDLHEAHPALRAIGLLDGADDVVAPALATEGPHVETREGVMHGSNGRNHFQFPPEDPAVSFAPTTPEERANRMAILTKAVICLGDIARYRELYNESGGRPKVGHEDGAPVRRGRNRRGGIAAEVFSRQRTYERAQLCYEQARLLLPYEGNPSHQLAILASYKKDSFASLVHYYRALCVRQPYDTAAENLGTVLTKALEIWRQRTRRGEKHVETPLAPRVRIEAFKEKVVVLHALWRVGMDKGVEKMNSISPKHSEKVSNDFYALVSERHLPIDMISNSIVLSQGALWKHRMIRDNTATHHAQDDSPPIPAGTSTIVEWAMLDHLLDLHYALLEVGKDELKDLPSMDGLDDLAQRISATFRRTLPALRIASKWLRANFKYVIQDQEYASFQQTEKGKGSEKKKNATNKISVHSTKTLRFWKTYAQFSLALLLAFPAQKLPSLSAPLEEDIEMRGFSPLRNLMGEPKISSEKLPDGVGQPQEQDHPNVEQLMRIADLLDDAKALVAMEDSPLLLINNHFIFNPEAVEVATALFANEEVDQEVDDPVIPIHQQQQLLATIRDRSLDLLPKDPDDDNMTERTSRTDDDVVRDAFKFLNTEEDVEDMEVEEDEIVWDPRANISPVFSPSVLATPITPVKPTLSPKVVSPRAFNAPPLAPAVPTTTAQDLLNDVINFGGGASSGRTISGNGISESTAPQPPFLFGSELSNRPSQSIWSASRDEQPLRFAGNGNASGQIYQTSPRQFPPAVVSPSQDLSQQSIWSSSYPTQSQNSQQYLIGALPSASFAQPPHSTLIGGGGHHRLPSASVASQLLPTHNLTQNDTFAYASPTSQHRQPVLNAEPHLAPTSSGYLDSSLITGGGFGGSGGIAAAQYYTTSGGASYHHSRQVSMHDPRQNYLSPPMSQMWSNIG
ncbi:hypothetical protein BYT27DRAFT_6658955 [Phlegmacium glaucopus]|nr:hypothetical protein BYT27DRAFT_6658955 [Phlegmacium glaucopus]